MSELIMNANNDEVKQHWISVDDQLPEIAENCWRASLPVNVMIEGFGQYICYPCVYGNREFYWSDALTFGNDRADHPAGDRDTGILNVTHWMPLPAPPAQGDKS
ncbi:DUF551 domain-containing protein [Acinetobacter radioresistens]